jgi:hypothetical protein
MSNLVAELAEKIQLLSAAEKNDLLRLLLEDIDGTPDADADETWRAEVVRRVKAIRNGEAAITALSAEYRE